MLKENSDFDAKDTSKGHSDDPVLGQILAAADRRQHILDILTATEHASSALFQTREDLRLIYDKENEALTLSQSTKEAADREKKEWESLKGSKLKKLFHRVKYNEKLQKEEDEYYEAYEWQLRAEASARDLSKRGEELRQQKDLLIKQVEQHREAEALLQDLYAEVFDGPTPGHPDEDALEIKFHNLQAAFDVVQGKITHTSHVSDAVDSAGRSLAGAAKAAQDHFDDTLSNIGKMAVNLEGDILRADDWSSYNRRPSKKLDAQGGTLELIRSGLAAADEKMAIAQKLDARVLELELPQIDPGNKAKRTGKLGDFLNAPLTDIIFYQQIDEAGEALETVAEIVAKESHKWKAELAALEMERVPLGEQMRECREELFQLRVKLFDQDVGLVNSEYRDKS